MFYSIIIPVKDRTASLLRCIGSIRTAWTQRNSELIIVDDGSHAGFRAELSEVSKNLPVRYIRQIHLGVSAARNNGVYKAKGDILLFIDSDCVIAGNFLKNFEKNIENNPDEIAFQPVIKGNNSTAAGIMEDLRLSATFRQLKRDDSRINYINTTAFAIKRSYIKKLFLFDPCLKRGEDTRLLLQLIKDGKLPYLMQDTIAYHYPSASCPVYIKNHFRIGYYNSPVRRQLAQETSVLMNIKARKNTFAYILSKSRRKHLSSRPALRVLAAYLLELCGRFFYKFSKTAENRTAILDTIVDPLTEKSLLTQIVSRAENHKGGLITYLTAWTLVLSRNNTEFNKLLKNSDVCYADGMGVVLTLIATRFQFMSKVTANNFYPALFREISNRKLTIALIGGETGVTELVKKKVKEMVPDINIAFCASGYFSKEESINLIAALKKINPHLIILGMGQPKQEQWAEEAKQDLPDSVFYCVGALFDLISGNSPSPPVLIRKIGMEWCWRFIHSPRKLWKRFLIGIPLLAGYILNHQFKFLLSKKKISREVSLTNNNSREEKYG